MSRGGPPGASSHNSQPWRFVVIDEPGLKEALCREAFSGVYKMSQFAAQAPVIVVVMAAKEVVAHRLGRRIQGVSFHLIDIGIAGEHLVLQAEELGLATCWMGWFNRRRARRVLKPPRKFEVVALLPVGYAASRPPRETVRKPLAEIAWWNGFGRADRDGRCGNDETPEK